MIIDVLAKKHQMDHPGYLLSDWYDAAMPAYQLQIRAQMMAQEALSPVGQYILRCLEAGVVNVSEIGDFLGLSKQIIIEEIEILEKLGCVVILIPHLQNSEKIIVTPKGKKTLYELIIQIPREENFPVCLDALSGEYLPQKQLLDKKFVVEQDYYQFPFYIGTPDITSLNLIALKSQWREYSGSLPRFMQDLKLLGVLEVEKVFSGYRIMRILQFIHKENHNVLVHVYDGHDRVYELEKILLQMEKEGLHALRSEQKPTGFLENELPDPIIGIVSPDAIQAVKKRTEELPVLEEQIDKLKNQAGVADRRSKSSKQIEEISRSEQEADNLRNQIADLQSQIDTLKSNAPSLEILSMVEHRPKLIEALNTSLSRVIIISPWLSLKAIDKNLRDQILTALRRNVEVWIGYGFGESKDKEKQALDKLDEIRKMKIGRNLKIQYLGKSHAKVIICDEKFMVTTSFNWLSFAGRQDWGNRIEFGILTSDKKAIKIMVDKLVPMFSNALDQKYERIEVISTRKDIPKAQNVVSMVNIKLSKIKPQIINGLHYLTINGFYENFEPILEKKGCFYHRILSTIFCLVSPGDYLMGSPITENGRRNDETQHEASLSNYLLVSETPCTQEMFTYDGRKNPSKFIELQKAVECVNYHEAVEWCRLLLLDLPTEMEWEYFCRAGTQTPYHTGNQINKNQATFNDVQNRYPVKYHNIKNAFGLYDLHGNVWEWCLDTYANYPNEKSVNYVNDPNKQGDKVFRGGCWRSDAGSIRSAVRGKFRSSYKVDRVGFRPIARIPKDLEKYLK